MQHFNDKNFKLGNYRRVLPRGLMKTRLGWNFTITICTLLMVSIALPQETLKQDSSATVTIVTGGDISVTRAADGKTAVLINFVAGKAKSICGSRRVAPIFVKPIVLLVNEAGVTKRRKS